MGILYRAKEHRAQPGRAGQTRGAVVFRYAQVEITYTLVEGKDGHAHIHLSRQSLSLDE